MCRRLGKPTRHRAGHRHWPEHTDRRVGSRRCPPPPSGQPAVRRTAAAGNLVRWILKRIASTARSPYSRSGSAATQPRSPGPYGPSTDWRYIADAGFASAAAELVEATRPGPLQEVDRAADRRSPEPVDLLPPACALLSSARLPDQFRRLDGIGLPFAVRGAPACDRACTAGGIARVTTAATMPNHVLAELSPVPSREQGRDIDFDLLRVVLRRPAEAARQPPHMGVDGDARDPEGVAEDHIGSLAPDAGQRHQVS